MFNLYYINYAKAFDIAMQIDNKVIDSQVVDSSKNSTGEGEASIESAEGLLGKLIPNLQGSLRGSMSKADRTRDTLKIVSTKSTILQPVIQKSVEVKSLDSDKIGKLVKIKDVSLTVCNDEDIMGSKILLSGLLKEIPVDGYGQMDLTGMMDTVLKGAAYLLTGEIPKKINMEDDKKSSMLLIKIPMQMDNEMESQYSIYDLEIGPVTLIGIYRGEFLKSDILDKVDVLKQLNDGTQSDALDSSAIETDVYVESSSGTNNNDKLSVDETIHYIDVIAITQELC